MGNFPVPVSGTAWASGGISGRVGAKNMKRRSSKRSYQKKPWESTNWIPYLYNFNLGYFIEDNAMQSDLVLKLCNEVRRVFNFAPNQMNQETLQPSGGGRVATETALKLRRIDGHIHFDGIEYLDVEGTPEYQVTAAQALAGVVERVYYAWQREEVTPSGYVQNIDDLGWGPGVLSGYKQLQSRKLLSWGTIDWTSTPRSAAGVYTGDVKGGRTWIIPNPRLPPGGLKLGINEALTCIVRASAGLMYGKRILDDYTNGNVLPIGIRFAPQMRLLVAG